MGGGVVGGGLCLVGVVVVVGTFWVVVYGWWEVECGLVVRGV